MSDEDVPSAGRKSGHGVTITALTVAVACVLCAVSAGFGHRFGLWDFRTGFSILRWSTYVAAGAGIVSFATFLAGAIRKQTKMMVLGLAGAIVAGALVLPVWALQRAGERVPHIHDISTDTVNPPAFVAIVPLRKDAHATNPVAYDGPKVAAEQKAAYADLHPIDLPMPPAQAFERALETARDMGWTIIATVPNEGRIEATDTTFWFGFTDDVVIRVAAHGSGSRVDIRSKSRVGRSDFGTNAARIRAFTRKLEAKSG